MVVVACRRFARGRGGGRAPRRSVTERRGARVRGKETVDTPGRWEHAALLAARASRCRFFRASGPRTTRVVRGPAARVYAGGIRAPGGARENRRIRFPSRRRFGVIHPTTVGLGIGHPSAGVGVGSVPAMGYAAGLRREGPTSSSARPGRAASSERRALAARRAPRPEIGGA